MADTENFQQFEVCFDEEVIQDLLTPGKVFEREILTPKKNDAEQAAGDVDGSVPTDHDASRSCIVLNKLSDTVIKLLVKVYKTPDAKPDQVEGSSQTDTPEKQDSSNQTETTPVSEGCMQTDEREISDYGTQTDNEQSSSQVQTELEQYDQDTQTVLAVCEQDSQTETELCEQDSQTETELCEQDTQTETEWHEQDTQTEIDLYDQDTQTEVELCEQITQTVIEQCEQIIQTEIECCEQITQTQIELNEQDTQTVLEQSEQDTQTEVELCEQDVQATVEHSEHDTQTLVELTDNEVQTWVPVLIASEVQTDIKYFSENEMQTDNPILVEGVMQTDLDVDESQAQTDISMFLVAEQESQTWIELVSNETQVSVQVAESTVQATVDAGDSECQTDVKELCHIESQATVESAEKFVQNAVLQSLNESQTDMSMALQQDAHSSMDLSLIQKDSHCQIEVAQSESESQTDAQQQLMSPVKSSQDSDVLLQSTQESVASDLPIPDENLPEGVLNSSHLASPSKSKCIQTEYESKNKVIQTLGPDYDASIEIASESDVIIEAQVPSTKKEDGCQTDPVTIIIGDASFLMKKIRSSSISPTKVSGSGNEIEIEVQADEYDVKENYSQPPARRGPGHSQASQKPLPATAPAPRVSARGVRTLPPRPVAPTQQIVNVPMEPQQIMQPPPPQRAPQRKSRPKKPLPVPAEGGGGKYSCPFCTLTFHESPALYDHLSGTHENDTVENFRKPKGREGKTIVPRAPTTSMPAISEPSMPVLVPVIPEEQEQSGPVQVVHRYVMDPHQAPEQELIHEQEADSKQLVVVQPEEPGLFEDPVELPIVPPAETQDRQTVQHVQLPSGEVVSGDYIVQENEPSVQHVHEEQVLEVGQQIVDEHGNVVGIVQQQVDDEEEEVAPHASTEVEEEHLPDVPVARGKRKRGSSFSSAAKRLRSDSGEEQSGELEPGEVPPVPSKRGRPTRQMLEQIRPSTKTVKKEVEEDESPRPRGRGRPPKRGKK